MLDDFRLIQPRCTVVWCIPFWSRKTSSYINPISRIRILQSVAEKLNKTILTGASDWRVCLNEDETEPYRVSKRHPGKLVADIVPCDAFLEEVRGILRRRGLIGIVKVEISSSVIHLNDYGLGCIEYSFEFSTFNVSNDDIDNWYSILLKSEFWRDFDALGNSYADGQLLPIHTSWSTLRIAIGEVFREQEIDFGELDEFVDQNSDHDLAWTRGCNIILYKSNDQAPPDLLDYRKKLTEITSCISNAYNQNITGTVTQRFYDTDFGSLDVYAAGFGFVALATTVGADGQESDFIPKKLRAMWRSFHINYAALTTASDRMQYISETSLKKNDEGLGINYDKMRKIVVAVASIRQNSSILLYSSDDLEDMIYSSCAESWSMDTVEKHLDAAIADADRATSRLNEVIMQRDEGRLAALGLIIAAIGGVSALQSLLQLVGMNIRDGWDLFYVRVGALVFYVFFTFCILVWMASGRRRK